MRELLSLTNTEYDLARFAGEADLMGFLREHGLDGLELMPYKSERIGYLPAPAIVGLHLGYFPSWVDFWNGNEEGVLREFGSLAEAEAHYGGRSRDVLVNFYRAQMDLAERLGARYVVFHVADVSLEECLSYRFLHTDEEVVLATVDLLSKVCAGRDYPFEFLAENLWWPGLTLARPEITEALLAGIPCARKGILLDTGHLMHMNRALETQEAGIDYILSVLNAHPDLAGNIRGIHLEQSLTGAFTESVIGAPHALSGTYFERLCQAYEFVMGMDEHRPFSTPAAKRLIRAIDPAYVAHEFIARDREELTRFLRTQTSAIR